MANKYNFETLEELRNHQRAISKKWYEKNREKKIKYQLDRYYNLKKQNQEQDLV